MDKLRSTGKRDIDGREIIEGDKLLDIEGGVGVVTYIDGRFVARDDLGWDNLEYPEESKVIGNVLVPW